MRRNDVITYIPLAEKIQQYSV